MNEEICGGIIYGVIIFAAMCAAYWGYKKGYL